MSDAKTVASTRVEMSQLMQPTDANFLGKVFGGAVLSMIDLVAYTTAARFAENVCVTASFDRVDFHDPIEVGEMVTMVGHVSYVGRTSLEVTINVSAEDLFHRQPRTTNTARVTMVAIRDGKPVPVPRLICETRAEKLQFLEGRMRRQRRDVHRAEFERILSDLALKSDADLDALIAGES